MSCPYLQATQAPNTKTYPRVMGKCEAQAQYRQALAATQANRLLPCKFDLSVSLERQQVGARTSTHLPAKRPNGFGAISYDKGHHEWATSRWPCQDLNSALPTFSASRKPAPSTIVSMSTRQCPAKFVSLWSAHRVS